MSGQGRRSEIRLTQTVHAPVERVWRACTDPRGLASWQADEVFGEAVEGGILTLSWPELDVAFRLDVLEVTHGQRIVFGSGQTKLALELTEGEIALEHSGLGEGDELEGVQSSWRLSLGILAHYCERHPDRARHVRWMVEPAVTSNQTAHVFFTDSAALSSWLGSGSTIGASGTRYALDLGNGERMSGTVIANTPGRDVALAWDEDDHSVICLRTLPRPFVKPERLIALSWSRWSDRPPPQARSEFLQAAHSRLTRALGATASA